MKLNLEQIRSITQGAVDVLEEDGGFKFYRFNKEEEEFYKPLPNYPKVYAASGVQLEFETDASALFLKTFTSSASTRSYFSFDVYVNGEFIGELKNFPDGLDQQSYTQIPFELGEYEKTFELGVGKKTVRIVFPFSVFCRVDELTLENATYVNPVKPKKILLAYGDSITHGYDAMHFSRSYIARLARALDAELYNKGIGGEIYRPGLAAIKNDLEPDYITVAYGTNDWNHVTRAEFEENSEGFLKNLCRNYPNAKIFVITPTFRVEHEEMREFGAFSEVAEVIKEKCEKLNINCIYGFDLIPHDTKYFGDSRIHPNEEGFDHYFRNLEKAIREIL